MIRVGDVIVSTTRPNLNAVAMVPLDLDDQICSTGFCVLRADHNLDRDYLFAFVQTQEFVQGLSELVRGALYPAVTDNQVKDQLIPLPPLSEQQRIAAILNEQMAAVERARAAAGARLEAAKALPAAYLRTVFNSPLAQKWPRMRLGEICEITARQVDPKVPEFGNLPHINGENIEGGMCRLTYLKTAAENGMVSSKYLFEPDDVLYSKLRPYLRKAVVADFRGVCSADMYPIRVNQQVLDPHFTAWMLVSDEFSKYADEESRRARMPKLNREQLFAWKIPMPSISEQRRLISMVSNRITLVRRTQRALEEELAAINALPAALLRRAFNGDL
ncbi:MAG: hypothetical protein A3F84_14280 [Candidatus Handelsmanbacteria bacterium RIFCSPLOWO2_12_FULL_64_10]|uniref:Type I restriction modification DNA specificity domain-containing protein n=1 Tax=Handelsmanbacteria sp. (strain RIFCSPLOWO2_12_FULL_64_10) TaxID=1817868 RepID=A0A1F6CJ39_HANXR|nr:MAG: hypothetical protein A3F84_14280 [Candidatus Handelsmanbacteria bacterium RIFCSPLOWO2_12_FULL_64_10]